MALAGNKGEWSEVYALLKVLGDGILYAGDENLNRVETLFYPIIKIIRSETSTTNEYDVVGDLIFISSNGQELARIDSQRFLKNAEILLAKIKSSKSTFSHPEVESFLAEINCSTLKAKSTVKSDIHIVIHDRILNQSVGLGFSIKSQLGGDSTLLNASRATNFVFRIEGIVPDELLVVEINSINSRNKIRDRIISIVEQGGSFHFDSLDNNIFQNNLILIDSRLPEILSAVVLGFFSSSERTIAELTSHIKQVNPLGYDISHSHHFYEYKIKRFLTDIALGMMPAKVWTGQYDATGGYLVVKNDGDIICYHIYNRNQFENYLYNNTRLESASSTRHEYGIMYQENGTWYFKLNLQIRFK